MSSKLLWAGVTCILGLPNLVPSFPWLVIGSLLLVVGLILHFLDK